MRTRLSLVFGPREPQFSLPSGTERLLYSFGKVMLGATTTSADGRPFVPDSIHPHAMAVWRDPGAAARVALPGAQFIVRYGGVVGSGVVENGETADAVVAPGVFLRPGAVPVSPKWVLEAEHLEATATDGEIVYVVADVVSAVRCADGEILWQFDPENCGDEILEETGLHASGGVVVGLASDKVIRVHAPCEYDIELDRTSGQLLRTNEPDWDYPTDRFRPLAPFAVRSFGMEVDLQRARARVPSTGEIAFELVVPEAMYDYCEPLQVNSTIVLGVATGHVVALEPDGRGD